MIRSIEQRGNYRVATYLIDITPAMKYDALTFAKNIIPFISFLWKVGKK